MSAPSEIVSPHDLIHEMRLRKSSAELEIMRAASAISAEAHHCAAHACKAGTHEYELEAELLRVFRKRGGLAPAYNPIVGTGENATILHYVENRDPLQAGQLVLIDAGVELHGYASDVTRGYPVGGVFSRRGARRVPGRARRAARGVPRGRAGREPARDPRGGAAPARGRAGRAEARSRATSTS